MMTRTPTVPAVCAALFCLGPVIASIAYDAVVWTASSEAENFMRLGRFPYDHPAYRSPAILGAIRTAMCSDDPRVRWNAYALLMDLHEEHLIADNDAALLFARGMRDPILETRLSLLGYVGHGELLDTLKTHVAAAAVDPDAEMRRKAIFFLGLLGEEGRFALPEVSWALKDPDPHVSQAARSARDEIERKR